MLRKIWSTGTGKGRRFLWPLIYSALILILFGQAALFRFRFPQVPFIDPDVRGYLVPAVGALAGNGFNHIEGRSFVYPGFVYFVLALFHHFQAISIIQHLFGLAAGGLLLVTWNRCGKFLGDELPYRLVGLGITALFLFNTSVLRFEYLIRPEAIFPFFVALSLFFNVQFTWLWMEDQREGKNSRKHRRSLFIYGVLTLFNAVLLFFLKPSFYLASLFSTAPICFFILDRQQPWQEKVKMLGLAIGSAILLLFLPEHLLKAKDQEGRTFLPATLFLIHAKIIREQIKKDFEQNAATPYPQEFLKNTYLLLDQEMNLSRSTGRYRSLGFDPDYLMYRDSFDKKFARLLGPASNELRIKFYYYYYFRAFAHAPLQMSLKILRQLAFLYNSVGKASPYKFEDHNSFGTSYRDNHQLLLTKSDLSNSKIEPVAEFERQADQLSNSDLRFNQPKLITWINRFLARTLTAFILLAFFLTVLIFRKPALQEKYGGYVLITLFFYGYSFCNSLGIAIVHTLEISRYLTNQILYCILPQGMTVYLIVALLLSRWRKPGLI